MYFEIYSTDEGDHELLRDDSGFVVKKRQYNYEYTLLIKANEKKNYAHYTVLEHATISKVEYYERRLRNLKKYRFDKIKSLKVILEKIEIDYSEYLFFKLNNLD